MTHTTKPHCNTPTPHFNAPGNAMMTELLMTLHHARVCGDNHTATQPTPHCNTPTPHCNTPTSHCNAQGYEVMTDMTKFPTKKKSCPTPPSQGPLRTERRKHQRVARRARHQSLCLCCSTHLTCCVPLSTCHWSLLTCYRSLLTCHMS